MIKKKKKEKKTKKKKKEIYIYIIFIIIKKAPRKRGENYILYWYRYSMCVMYVCVYVRMYVCRAVNRPRLV